MRTVVGIPIYSRVMPQRQSVEFEEGKQTVKTKQIHIQIHVPRETSRAIKRRAQKEHI